MKINDKEYNLKYTGRTLLIYKEQFHSDMMVDCQKIKDSFNMLTLMQICWAMLKAGDKEAPDYEEFLDNVEVNDTSMIEEMNACLFRDGSVTKVKKK